MKLKRFDELNEEISIPSSDVEESGNWDELAQKLCDELGESLIDDDSDENNPYDWWLQDATVTDIIDFIKKNKNLIK